MDREVSVPMRAIEWTGYYSSAAFFCFAVFKTLYGIIALLSFAEFFKNHGELHGMGFAFACVSVSFRVISIVLMWLIWLAKPGLQSVPPSKTVHSKLSAWMSTIQACFPLTISAALTFRLIAHLVIGSCQNEFSVGFCNPYKEGRGMSITLSTELMFNPIIVAFLLRDTRLEALIFSWMAAVGVLIAFCAVQVSPDIIIATVSYVFFSVLLFWDNERHRRALFAVVDQLKQALIDNEQLAKAAMALELRAMIGNVAHDLKTPLTSFLNGIECVGEIVTSWETQDTPTRQSQFLERSRGNLAAIRKCLQEMKSTTAFMTMSINRCLDYTKANAGVKLVPKLETVYLRSLLDMPVKMMRDMLSGRILEVTALDEDICSHVITDKQWLLENLLCLLSNAVKYSTKGTVEVAVYLVSAESLGSSPLAQHLRFEVLDMGIGLSDEAMETLFAPFKQAQRLAGGTGLGLYSLAKRIEALQGQYGVSHRSDGAQGSLFWFTIPYRPDELAAEMNSESSAKSSTIISLSDDSSRHCAGSGADSFKLSRDPGTVKYTILVVDDSPMIVRMTTMLLSRKGHDVKHAVNGAEALDLIIAGYTEDTSKPYEQAGTPAFDVVLMDLQMPIMDGPLAMRRLRVAEEQLRLKEYYDDWEGDTRNGFANQGMTESEKSSSRELDHWKLASKQEHQQGQKQECKQQHDHHFHRRRSISAEGDSEGDIELGLHINPTPTETAVQQRYHQFIIAVSANSDLETVQDALAAGADEFMVKPFAYDKFIAFMEKRG